MPTTHQQRLDYQTRWRRDHGIRPLGEAKSREKITRRRTKLSEQSPRKWQRLSPEAFAREANKYLQKGV